MEKTAGGTDVVTARFTVRNTSGGPNTAPSVAIVAPAAATAWRVGQTLSVQASASDAEEGTLPSSAISWVVEMEHCPAGECHLHAVKTIAGAAGTFTAPDHQLPSTVLLRVTARDSGARPTPRRCDSAPRRRS